MHGYDMLGRVRGAIALQATVERVWARQHMKGKTVMSESHRSITEAIDEVERECNVRARCFPRWITEGKLTRTDAKDRQDRMDAALYYLKGMDPDPPAPANQPEGITPDDVASAKALFERKQAEELAAAAAAGQAVEPPAKPMLKKAKL